MYMLKNKFLLAFFALVFSTALKAQTITIDDARLALPAGQTYGSGSVVAVPVSLNGCFAQNNVFTWVLQNAGGTAIDSGKVTVFYATYINATLPISLATGQYKFLVKASTVGSVSATSALFDVTNVALPIIARAVPAFSDLILRDEYYYGICDGNPLNGYALNDSSTVGGTDSLELVDNYRVGPGSPFITKFPSVSGKFNLTFSPVNTFGKNRDAYYTAFVKTISPSNIVSTKGYHIINNSWDISTYVEAKSANYSCAGDTISLGLISDRTQAKHIQQNFPGALININWKDNSSANYTQCQVLAANSKILHPYLKGSCELPNNSVGYDITTTVTNPFNVFNGPGITATCAAGAKDVQTTSIFTKPLAIFNVDTVVCANDTIKFTNLSNPGQGVANQSGLPTCAQLANYTWVIDGNIGSPLYQTQNGKVEPRKDTAYSFNSNQPGYHTVSLYINNNYGFQAPCPSHDTLKRFCVDTAKVRPDFKLDSAGSGVLKDSIIGCAPVFCIKNVTKRTFCVDTTQFNYYWRVLDATSPGPNYLEVQQGVNYSFTSGNKRSKSPCISINKTGKYFIELMASASCDLDSSTRMMKYVEANGDAGVNFPTGSDTLKFCGYTTNTSTLTIDYSPTAPINVPLNLFDSVNYTYQPSTAGVLSFGWNVTKNGGSAVYGTDYTFAGSILDSALQYPKITFRKPGLYRVRVRFSNNCQPKTAIQYVAFREIIKVSSGSTSGLTDSICHTTPTFQITGASASTQVTNSTAGVGKLFWTCDNCSGTFNPQSGTPLTPNIFNPVFTPSQQDLANACSLGATVTLRLQALATEPSNCAVVSSPRNLFIRPCVTVSDTAFNSCSGSAVNYQITKPGLVGSTFTWTYTNIAPGVTGANAGSGIKITDILSGSGIVQYTLLPQKDGCVGNSFTVTDTVRPIPSSPSITLLYPNNATQSMCSDDTAKIQIANGALGDLYNWNWTNQVGQITGFINGSNQSTDSIQNILKNNSLVVDTATISLTTTNKYGCVGTSAATLQVIVTPGPNTADIYGPQLKYLCNLACDTIKHSSPGVAGLGVFSVTFSNLSPSPTLTTLNDSTTLVCGMKPTGFYKFEWKVDPVLAGCITTRDSLEISVTDTIPTPFAGLDTAICDVNGVTQRVVTIKGTLSRAAKPTEFIYYNGAGPAALNTPFYFTNKGTYPIQMRVRNFVCPDKVDTVLVRAFGKPLGGSITINPIQSSFCQGSSVTLTSNFDTSSGDIGRWYYQIFKPPFTTFNVGSGQNPYTHIANESAGFNSLVISKGWNYGCKDSVYTSGYNIAVDSATIAGTVSASDSVVCVPGTVVVLTDKGQRGAVQGWIRSSTAVGGYGSIFAIGNPVSVSVNATTWYRAIVKNGNCNTDTTAPFRIFVPSGADVALTGNDTAVCGAITFNLSGNVPVVGNGLWKLVGGPVQTKATPFGAIALGAIPNDTTSQNPVVVHIQEYGTYKFIWKVKNLNCDASEDTIVIKNTEPINVLPIATTQDTVCTGTTVVVTGFNPTTSGTFSYSWQYSSDNGTTWTVGSLAANSYTFTTSTDVWVRRVIKSDSCYDFSNIIKFIVQPKIGNNIITPATNATCINTPVPNFTGSLPTGGSGTYNYIWNYGNSVDTSNNLWNNPGVATQNYNAGFNLTDTLHFRRIVTSGKCTDTSLVSTILLNPDAKATFSNGATIACAPFVLPISPAPQSLITNYTWYADTAGIRFQLGTGAGFPGYTIIKGLDSVKITLIAASTQGCKSDSLSKWFYTSATPAASFTISADSGCANNTGISTTTFNFTNTTPNIGLFNYVFNYGDGNSPSLVNPYQPLPHTYAPSTTGLDTIYNVCISALSAACGSSQVCNAIKIRTRPKVSFGLSPTYQCSGGLITFTNQTVGSPNLTWNWNFDDKTANATTQNTTHIYNDTVLTTHTPKLIASNECASDSSTNSVVIAANTVTLNISVKGTDKYKCLPDTVTFYTNSTGGTIYTWDFGDGSGFNPSTNGKDSITYIYTKPGKFVVSLTGSTTCGSVVKTDTAFAYGTPVVAFSIAPNTTVCKGDTVRFTNLTDTASSYIWNFGNGLGGGVNPTRTYGASGNYAVQLEAKRLHTLPLGGNLECSAKSSIQTVTIRDTMPASFTITPLGASCLPYAVQFNNTTNITTLPISTTNWTFGVPLAQSSGNPVSYTYNQLGQYNVNLTVTNAGNCTYIDSQKVIVSGPIGTWTHDTGYVCGNSPVNFQINANSTDSVTINYGDAPAVTVLYSTLPNPFTHVYSVGGNYTPTITLKSVNGCSYFIGAIGTIRVDYVKAGYTINTPIQNCGNTVQGFTNKTLMDQSPGLAAYVWNINGVTYNVANPSVTLNTTGVYNVRMQVTSVSGCFDSVATAPLYVKVNNVPNIVSITRQDTACAGQTINYTAVLSPSEDPISNYNWTFGNGQTGSGISTQTIYGSAGIFSDNLTVVTSNGCTSSLVKGGLVINPTPTTVSINPSTDTLICAGSSLTLTASGANSYVWSPNLALTPNTTSATVTVAPPNLTKYVVEGFNAFGCSDTASIRVSTVNDYSITISASPNDSICKGDSITLKVVGAPASSSIVWSPSTGITTPTNVASVTVKPSFTTQYKVDVTDSAACFPHNETIWVGVGDTTSISLGLDSVYLQGGTTLPLTPSVVNGPIATWAWTPATNLSCSDCGNPIATVKENICYSVEATSIYGCKAEDNICIVAFCEASQVFIPNAFTPDGDGVNDYLWIKARGIKSVKSFRIFNRWGQVVFERANFVPVDYDRINAWDGKIKGVIAPTEVYVYTCEVICENGTKFTYTGNIAVIK